MNYVYNLHRHTSKQVLTHSSAYKILNRKPEWWGQHRKYGLK